MNWYRGGLIVALVVALVLAGISIAPEVRARWFSDSQGVQLIVAVLDNTQAAEPVDVIVHVPGEVPWQPTFSDGVPAEVMYFSFYPVDQVHTFTVEILGESDTTFDVEFRMTEDMEPIDTRNRVEIDVRDQEVLVSGPLLSAGAVRTSR